MAAMDMAAVVDETKSLNEGALLAKGFEVDSWWRAICARSGMFDLDELPPWLKPHQHCLFSVCGLSRYITHLTAVPDGCTIACTARTRH